MKFQIHTSSEKHDEFVKKSSQGNLLQSSDWAKVKDNWNSEIVSVLADDTNEILASALVLIKTLPAGFTMLYIPRGPVLDYSNPKLLTFFFEELRKWAKTKRALFIKFDPNLVYESSKFDEAAPVPVNEEAKQCLSALRTIGAEHFGFNQIMGETIQPRIQANEKLQSDIEKIYPKHTRRLMKDASNRGVKVARVGEEGLEEFARLIELTVNRKGVALRNLEYFKKLMHLYAEDAYLHLASVNVPEKKAELTENLTQFKKELSETPEDQKKRFTRLNDQINSTEKTLKELEEFGDVIGDTVIAGILSIKFGDTMEMLYAGMDEKFKKFYPQYILYTLTFNDAIAAGSVWANMGGIEGSLDDGLSKFKSNFNPDVQRLIGEFTIRTSPLAGLGLWVYNKRKSSNQ